MKPTTTAGPGLAVGRNGHQADGVESQPAEQPAQHAAQEAVEHHLGFAQGYSLADAGRDGRHRPRRPPAHHEDQKTHSRRHLTLLGILPKGHGDPRHDDENESRGEEGDQTTGKTDPQTDGSANGSALRVAAHDPFHRPQEQPDEARDRGKEQHFGPFQLIVNVLPIVEERLDDHPGDEGSQCTRQAQVEVAGEKKTNDERRRLGPRQDPVEHGLLVEECVDLGCEQFLGSQSERFLRMRRRHGQAPEEWREASKP